MLTYLLKHCLEVEKHIVSYLRLPCCFIFVKINSTHAGYTIAVDVISSVIMKGENKHKCEKRAQAHGHTGGEYCRVADTDGRRYLRLSSGNGFIASFITTSTHVILCRRHNSSFAGPLQCTTSLFH